MIGSAYSSDASCGYDYIVIKSYDCDDISFVNPDTSFQLLRICRNDSSAELLYSNKKDEPRHLSYKYATAICNELIKAEYKADYPVVISWSINHSGILEIKSVQDNDSLWPLTPYHIEINDGYIHMTDALIDGVASYLKSGFVSEVINEAAYYCGICMGDMVTVIGDEIYATFNMVHLLKHLFGSSILYEISLRFSKIVNAKIKKIKPQKILDKIKEMNFDFCYDDFDARELYIIKSECIKEIIASFEFCLKNRLSVDYLADDFKSIFTKAFKKLECQKENFVFYSGGKNTSDINYLTFSDLMMTYSFGGFKDEMSEKIKINRKRKRALKELEVPQVIYKRKLYFY